MLEQGCIALEILALVADVYRRERYFGSHAGARQRARRFAEAQFGSQVADKVDAAGRHELLDGQGGRTTRTIDQRNVINADTDDAPGEFSRVFAKANRFGHHMRRRAQSPLASVGKRIHGNRDVDRKMAAPFDRRTVQQTGRAVNIQPETAEHPAARQQAKVDKALDVDAPGRHGAYRKIQAGPNPHSVFGTIGLNGTQTPIGRRPGLRLPGCHGTGGLMGRMDRLKLGVLHGPPEEPQQPAGCGSCLDGGGNGNDNSPALPEALAAGLKYGDGTVRPVGDPESGHRSAAGMRRQRLDRP